MKAKHGRKTGLILVAAGCLLLIFAAGILLMNIRENDQAQQAAANAAEAILHQLPKEVSLSITREVTLQSSAFIDESSHADGSAAEVPLGKMPVVSIEGDDYIGIISIPSIGIKLPVMSEWSYPNLKKAPCMFMGSVYERNAIIAAHNYKSHFRGIMGLSPGDKVIFYDLAGNEFRYTVAFCEVLQPTDIDAMTSSGFDLSLFTCTIGGKTRYTVRCSISNIIPAETKYQ